jgi:hypothetical protein
MNTNTHLLSRISLIFSLSEKWFTRKLYRKSNHILCSKTTPPPLENGAVYEIMWKLYGGAGEVTDDNIIRRMGIACWIPKATNTHSQYVILIAFPLQQW